MKFKTELHAHSREVSPCADFTVQEVTERYLSDGYTSLVLTNHYTSGILESAGETWEERITYYLAPYRQMKEYAKGRLNILLGCELRFTENNNDYLILGVTEEFLIEHPELYRMNLKSFSALARENGLLVVQAHPFRNGMTVMPPAYLDGVEVFNGHMGHDSRNPIADAWAKKFGLLETAGTDFHHPHQNGVAGILTDEPIETWEQLLAVLKSGSYTLHCTGPRSEAEGIVDHSPAKI